MAKLGDVIRPAKVIRCNDNQYPILSMTMHDGIILQSSRFKKNLASVDQSNYKVVNYGQLVIGFPIDEGVLYIQKIVEKGIMSPAYNVWDVNYEIVDPDYLEFCLHSPQSMQYYKENLRGTTARRRSIPTDTLLKLPIYLPSLGEQRKIAMVLNQINNLIAKRRAQLDKLDLLVKARFVEMFGEKYSESTLLSLCKIIDYRGKTPPKVDFGIPFITAKNIKMHHMTFETREYISKETYDKVMVRGFPQEGDVVFTTEAPLGNVCRIPHFATEFYIGQRIVTLQTTTLNPVYLEYALDTESFKKKIAEKSSGSTVTGIRVRLLEQLTIPVPPIERQNKFAITIEKVEHIKRIAKCSLGKLETLKKALMQEYFG